MSTNYSANPTNAPIINRPGESKEYTGLRNVKDLLPNVLQTHMNNKFFDSTIEQIFASGSLQAINNYIGASEFVKLPEDNYLKKERFADNYQFVPSIVNRDNNNNITDVLSYDDLIKSMEFHGVDTSNHNMLLNETGYTLGLPINYDMFINYHKYFWVLNKLPIVDIIPTDSDPVDIDDIVGSINYTTPVLDNGKQITFGNGMRIRFSPIDVQKYTQTVAGTTNFAIGVTSPDNLKVYLNYELVSNGVDYNVVGNDIVFVTAPEVNDEIEVHSGWTTSSSGNYVPGEVYIIDNVSQPEGIVLIKQYEESINPFEPGIGQTLGRQAWLTRTLYGDYVGTPFETPTGFDTGPFDQRFHDLIDRDYVVEFRFSNDQSAWARSNLWVKQDVIQEVVEFLDLDLKFYTNDLNRAVRPIIEFRGNTEKYDFGSNHIMNVTHVMELIPDPSTDIIGKTNFNLAEFVATTQWTDRGFGIGDKVYFELGGQTTYWECIKSHGDSRNPYYFENKEYWKQIISKNIENNDTVLFLDSNPTYDNNIYRATVDADGKVLALTEIVGSTSTPVQIGDKIAVVIGYNDVFGDPVAEKNNIWSGSEWYWNGSDWVYGQQKDHRSEGILYQLYDIDRVKLDDETVYPNSSFNGDIMFDYGKSESSMFDFALGFKPRRVDYGNNPGFDFDIGCGNVRYEYNIINDNPNQSDSDTTNVLPIKGFYYYKNTDSGVFVNNWKEIDQPVKRFYQNIFDVAETQHIVELGTNDINADNKFTVLKRGDNLDFYTSSTLNSRSDQRRLNGSNPILYLKRNKTYTFKTHFDETELEFTDTKGNIIAGITRSAATNDEFTLVIDSSVTDNIIKYTKTSGTPSFGYIYLNDSIKDYTIDVIVRNGNSKTILDESIFTINNKKLFIDYAFSSGDVVDVTWYSDNPLDNGADGEFLPAETHILNPQNLRLENASFGDLQDHIQSQMENIPGFIGDYFGDNNYVNIPFNNIFGGTIRQQAFSTEILAETSASTDTNPFSSIRYSAQSYRRFRSLFVNKAKQLHKTLDSTVPVYQLVDEVLKQMNMGKNRASDFSQSDMALYKDYESVDVRWHNGDSQTFDLPKTVNKFDNTFNHVQIWVKDVDGNGVLRWRALQKDIDYALTEYSITITAAIIYDSNDDAYAHIRWYPQNAVSFVPPSAVKLGLIRPFKTQRLNNLYVDFGYIENQNDYIKPFGYGDYINALILHDGSIHIRIGDELFDRNSSEFNIVDAVIWELETRISNNLIDDLNDVIDYKKIMPNFGKSTVYTWNDLTAALEDDFVKWKIRNKIDTLNDPTFYNAADKFTWNYSSVGPGIGGFKGIYIYYFNTDRPDTHPWEMFGYNTRPSWWDANYSWSDPVKRAALVEALRLGHYNDPSETPKYDISYAYSFYDWVNNDLVKTDGDLNDPVSANVVPEPSSIEASKDFEFGDWGPVENAWRISSEYKISLFAALMKLRPLWVTNNYFNSINRHVLDTLDYDTVQYYFSDSRELGNNRDVNLTYTQYEGKTIDNIRVVNGGSGYVTAPNLTVYSNFGTDAKVTAHIEGGSVVAVSIEDSGENYQGNPTILPDTGAAEFEAYVKTNVTRYFTGFSNSIVDYARYNNVSVEDLITRFANSDYSPIVKFGGFVNRNQDFILESSQDKGRVIIPEENVTTLIYRGQPKDEKFFGSIKVTKTEDGFRISGVDNINQTFTYYPVNTDADFVNLTVENRSVNRYSYFRDFTQTIPYNTVIESVQDTFNFIRGYVEYIEKNGWSITKWTNTSNNFVSWAYDTNTKVGDYIYVKPDTSRIYIIEPENGYYDNLTTRYDGGYNLMDANGKQINLNRVLVSRDIDIGECERYTLVERKDNQTVIHGLRLYNVELEHVAVFDNATEFDDIIYNPALGQYHRRIVWRGSRTKDWNGKLYAPGYVVLDNTVINNFDTTARELDQYYGPGQTLNNQQMLDVARFNVGYNKPLWAEQMLLDDDTAWNLVKGSYKYKGTHNLLKALQRTTSLYGSITNIDFHEEWAIRTSDYGDTRPNNVLEFQFKKDLIKTNPQPVRFTDGVRNDILNDIVIDVDSNSDLLITGNPGNNFTTIPFKSYFTANTTTTFGDIDLYKNDLSDAGFPLTNETDYRILNKDHFKLFPDDINGTYNFYGDWQDIEPWDNQVSYKYGDRVIYQGKVWEMISESATGYKRPNIPIQVLGSIISPVVSTTSPPKTLILGTSVANSQTIEIQSSLTVDQYETIVVSGNITSPTVPNGDTIILSVDDNTPVIVTFSNTEVSTVYQDIVKVGSVTNPTIVGGANKKLTIDNIDIPFTGSTTTDELTLNPVSNGSEWNINGGTVDLSFDDGGYTLYIDSTSADITVNDFTPTPTNEILTINNISVTDPSRVEGTYSVSSWSSTGSGSDAIFQVIVDNTGEASVLVTDGGSGFTVGETITIPDSELGGGGATDLTLVVSTVADDTIRKFRLIINGNPTAYEDTDTSISVTSLAEGSFTSVQIEAKEWPTQLDFDTDSNGTVKFEYDNNIKKSSINVIGSTYDLSQIITNIQSVLDSLVYTVDSFSNRLRIRKTTDTPEVEFTMRINSATANAEVGFEPVSELLVSSSDTLIENPDLTLSQVVTQINNAGIEGIITEAVNDRIRFTINNAQKFVIGNGTANNDLGIVANQYIASTVEVVTPVSSNLSRIIDLINNAGISGISATNSSERLQLTCTEPTLYIGAGSANSDIGLTAGTTSATQGTVSNVFEAISSESGDTIFLELEDDPHTFNMWIANDNENYGGYSVYQTMDFDFYIVKACAGITEADDALIELNTAHNLSIGDYILIRGSNTTPSIDGIHQVSNVDLNDPTKFFIDEFIEEEGNIGNVYPIKNVRFSSYANLLSAYNSQTNGVYKYNFTGKRQGLPASPIYAFIDNDGTGKPATYRFTGTFSPNGGHVGGVWRKVRTGEERVRNDLIDSVKKFDAKTQSVIETFEIYDPIKGIIPGFIDSELDFKQTNDLAIYNFSTLDGGIDQNEDKAWQDEYIGVRWWDLKTAVYINYEQSSIDYRQNNWGRLFDGSSIDIYEWTKSPVLPEEWEDFVSDGGVVDGIPASGQPFSVLADDVPVYYWVEKMNYNKRKNRLEKVYYFWVKNKLSKPAGKFYNTTQLTSILENPTAYGTKWAAATGPDELLIANGFDPTSEDTVIQIKQKYPDSEAITNTEYTILGENNPSTIIPEYLHIKMRDNIVGYNQYSQRYPYSLYDNGRVYSQEEVVQEGSDFYISISDSNLGNTPSLDVAQEYWKKVYDYQLPNDTPVDDIDILEPLLIPDISLHPFNRYGHLERPVQSLNRNVIEARQNIIYTINDLFSQKVFVNEFSNIDEILGITFTEGEKTYDMGKYWTYVDYVRREYDEDGNLLYEFDNEILPSYYVDKLSDIETISGYNENDLVYVRFVDHWDKINRPVIIRLVNGEWVTEWKRLGTISVSEELWNQEKFGHGFDNSGFDMSGFDANTSNILKVLLDILREKIFANTNREYYTKLWFSWLNHAVTENTTSEFAFKTTFGTLKVEHPLLTNATKYQKFSTKPIEDFLNDNKPFHTKIRQVLDIPTHTENTGIEISESYTISIIV